MSKKDSFLKHMLIIGGGAIINFVVGLITLPLITRLVDPEQYGQMSMFTTYSSIASLVLTFGLDQALVRFFYQSDDDEYKRRLLTRCWLYPFAFMLLLSIPCAAFFSLFNKSLGEESLIIVILFLLDVYILFLNRYAMLILRLEKKSKMYSAATIAHKVLYVLIIISWVPFEELHHFRIMATASVCSYGITTLIAILSCRKKWIPSFTKFDSEQKYSNLIKYGLPLMVSSGVYLFFQAIDRISLQFFVSYTEVGIYSSAMSLMSIITIVRTAFTTVWMPSTIEKYEQNPEDKTFYQNANRYMTVLMFFIGFSLILCKDIIVLFLGEKYRASSVLLPFLLFQPIMYTVSETTVIGVYFKKKSYAHVIIAGISCAVNLTGNLILIPIIGPKGAAISTGVSYIVFFTLRTLFSNRYYYVDYKLWKFYSVTALLIIFALYNTFWEFSIYTVGIYIISIAVILILYKQTVLDMLKTGLSFIKRKRIKEK